MTEREALKLTLAALKQIDEAMPFPVAKLAIKKAEEALAQPEQEPRAWINWSALTGEPRLGWECESELASEPLYTAPPQRKPEQEPVAWGMPSAGGGFVVDCITPEEHDRVEGGYTIPLYTTPPQRTWVGLTDDEREQCWAITSHEAMRNVEAKLKEKNT